MSRKLVLAGALAASLAAGAAQAQRLEVDSNRKTSFVDPIAVRVGEVIDSDISDTDFKISRQQSAEMFVFTARAGEVITGQFHSDIPTLGVNIIFNGRGGGRGLLAQAGQPIRYVAPKDGTYTLMVFAHGPKRYGRYQLALGSGDVKPSADVPTVVGSPQRVEIEPARSSSLINPIPLRPGQLVAGDISDTDFNNGPDWRADIFSFVGTKGQVVTAQVQTDIPTLLVGIRFNRSHTGKPEIEGPAKDAPLRFVLPRDGAYHLYLHAQGPQHTGRYVLSFGDDRGAPPFDPPKPPPVQVAKAEPAPAPAVSAPKAPPTRPTLPTIPGVLNLEEEQTQSRPAGKAGEAAEMFQFIAGAGSKVRLAASGAGPLVVTLYTPEGAVMLNGEGMDVATVEAFLPVDSLYFVSVARSDPSKPYKLALAVEEADPSLVLYTAYIGYPISNPQFGLLPAACWVAPGKTLLSSGTEITLGAGGRVSYKATVNGQKVEYDGKVRLEGDVAVTTFISRAQGNPVLGEARTPLNLEWKRGPYAGYRCR